MATRTVLLGLALFCVATAQAGTVFLDTSWTGNYEALDHVTISGPGDIVLEWNGSEYWSNGSLDSSIQSFGSSAYDRVWWNATENANTSVMLQFRTGNDPADVANGAFRGPDGSQTTFYTQSGAALWSGHRAHSHLQYRVWLATNETATSPVVHDMSLALNNIPSISLVEPSNTASNTSYAVQWTDSDPDDSATVNLYYDSDQLPGGEQLVASVPEDDPGDQFIWDLSGIAPGSYYLVANISDGIESSQSRSSSVLVVDHPTFSSFDHLPTLLVPDGNTYEIITRHVDYSGSGIDQVRIEAQSSDGLRPGLNWDRVLGFSPAGDPGLLVPGSSWSEDLGPVLLIHWNFSVSYAWTAQHGLDWETVAISSDSGPMASSGPFTRVETDLEMISLQLVDLSPPVAGPDAVLENGEWVRGRDEIGVSGEVRFVNTSRHPSSGAVNVLASSILGDVTNGSFALSFEAPASTYYSWAFPVVMVNLPAGAQDVSDPNLTTQHLSVDAHGPQLLAHSPQDGQSIPGPSPGRQITFHLTDNNHSGIVEPVTLSYWLEGADADGIPAADEYQVRSLTPLGDGNWTTYLDESPNLPGHRISFFLTARDLAGNYVPGGGPGFFLDLATYRTGDRVDSSMEVTGIDLPDVIHPTIPFLVQVDLRDFYGALDLVDLDLHLGETTVHYTRANNSAWSANESLLVLDQGLLSHGGPDFSLALTLSADWTWSPHNVSMEFTDVDGPGSHVFSEQVTFQPDIVLGLQVQDEMGPVQGQITNGGIVAYGDQIHFEGNITFEDGEPPLGELLVGLWRDGAFQGTAAVIEGLFDVFALVEDGSVPGEVVFEVGLTPPGDQGWVAEQIRLVVDRSPVGLVSVTPDSLPSGPQQPFILEVQANDDSGSRAEMLAHWSVTDSVGNSRQNGTWSLDLIAPDPTELVWSSPALLSNIEPAEDWELQLWFETFDLAGNEMSTTGNSEHSPAVTISFEARVEDVVQGASEEFFVFPSGLPFLGGLTVALLTSLSVIVTIRRRIYGRTTPFLDDNPLLPLQTPISTTKSFATESWSAVANFGGAESSGWNQFDLGLMARMK